MLFPTGTKTKKDDSQKTKKIHTNIEEQDKISKELLKNKERFREISEKTSDWFWEIDKTGLFTYSSIGIEKILGYKPEEILGKMYFYDLFCQDSLESFKKMAFEIFQRNGAVRLCQRCDNS